MNWLFKSRMSARDKESGLALIRHLQKMLAYQQLTMEGYNDAVAFAAGVGTPTNEGLLRLRATVSDTSAVTEHVLPALRAKQQVLKSMETEHTNMGQPTTDTLKRAYDDFSRSLRVMQERTRLQYDGFSAWVEDQTLAVETSRLDAAEQQAMDQALGSLNELIRKVGVDRNAWLDLVCDAFNAVRESVGLLPMPAQEFRTIYLGGLAGKPARFFAR